MEQGFIDVSSTDAMHWVRAVDRRTGWGDEKLSLSLLSAVLRALRDMLSDHESAMLTGHLPVVLRGVYFDGWHPSNSLPQDVDLEALIERVIDEVGADHMSDPVGEIRAVFDVLRDRIPDLEFRRITGRVSDDIKGLFLA